ncbi:MAG: carboxypeptidase-like regulatory domain-containing protein [Bryobacteraceae bacterium]
MTRIWIAFVAFALSLPAQNTGIISGTLNSGGHPVSGASVAAYLQASETGGKFAPVFNALTGADGSFVMNGVPAGKYLLCAEKASAALLNPCFWSATPSTVTVAGGGNASVELTAQTGVSMIIRVNDPNGLLASDPSVDDILVSAKTASGLNILAVLASKDSSGRTMAVLVPQGAPVNLMIYSSRLSLTDNNGDSFATPNVAVAATAPGGPTAEAASSVASSAALTVTIQGKK